MKFNAEDSFAPFGAGGLNTYAYCKGDPLNLDDPSGHGPGLNLLSVISGVFAIGSGYMAATTEGEGQIGWIAASAFFGLLGTGAAFGSAMKRSGGGKSSFLKTRSAPEARKGSTGSVAQSVATGSVQVSGGARTGNVGGKMTSSGRGRGKAGKSAKGLDERRKKKVEVDSERLQETRMTGDLQGYTATSYGPALVTNPKDAIRAPTYEDLAGAATGVRTGQGIKR